MNLLQLPYIIFVINKIPYIVLSFIKIDFTYQRFKEIYWIKSLFLNSFH